MRPPTLFFFKIVLATQGTLRFHMNFRVDFSIYEKKKKHRWDFDRDCIDHCDFKEGLASLGVPWWQGSGNSVRMNGGLSRRRRHRLSTVKSGVKGLPFSKILKSSALPRPPSKVDLHGRSVPICIMGIALWATEKAPPASNVFSFSSFRFFTSWKTSVVC